MAKKNGFSNIGSTVQVPTPVGVSLAGSLIDFRDFDDCRVAIEHCGGGVFELWIHTANKYSVRVVLDEAAMQSIGRQLISATEKAAA